MAATPIGRMVLSKLKAKSGKPISAFTECIDGISERLSGAASLSPDDMRNVLHQFRAAVEAKYQSDGLASPDDLTVIKRKFTEVIEMVGLACAENNEFEAVFQDIIDKAAVSSSTFIQQPVLDLVADDPTSPVPTPSPSANEVTNVNGGVLLKTQSTTHFSQNPMPDMISPQKVVAYPSASRDASVAVPAAQETRTTILALPVAQEAQPIAPNSVEHHPAVAIKTEQQELQYYVQQHEKQHPSIPGAQKTAASTISTTADVAAQHSSGPASSTNQAASSFARSHPVVLSIPPAISPAPASTILSVTSSHVDNQTNTTPMTSSLPTTHNIKATPSTLASPLNTDPEVSRKTTPSESSNGHSSQSSNRSRRRSRSRSRLRSRSRSRSHERSRRSRRSRSRSRRSRRSRSRSRSRGPFSRSRSRNRRDSSRSTSRGRNRRQHRSRNSKRSRSRSRSPSASDHSTVALKPSRIVPFDNIRVQVALPPAGMDSTDGNLGGLENVRFVSALDSPPPHIERTSTRGKDVEDMDIVDNEFRDDIFPPPSRRPIFERLNSLPRRPIAERLSSALEPPRRPIGERLSVIENSDDLSSSQPPPAKKRKTQTASTSSAKPSEPSGPPSLDIPLSQYKRQKVKQAKSAATVPSIERQLEKSLDELIGSKRSPATPIAEPATCKLPSTATSQATTSTTPPAPAKITPSTTNVPVEKQQSTKQKDHPDQAPVTGAVPVQSSPAPVLERVEAEASDDGALVHQSLAEQAEVHRLQAMMRQRTGGRRLAPPSKTLWIGNLPATANRRTLQDMFNRWNPLSFKILKSPDGLRKASFVNFASEDDATEAYGHHLFHSPALDLNFQLATEND